MYDFNNMPDGPTISGSWYNKRTGKTIVVRDMFMDDSGMQVMTSMGEMIDGEEFSRDYIQCDDKVYDDNGNVTGQSEPIDYESMFGGMEAEQPKSPTYSDIMGMPVTAEPVAPANKKFEMLDTMFDKLVHKPNVIANIKWKNIPKSELKMMQTYFDVSIDDIADYIYTKFCTSDDLKKAISENIISLLNKNEK